MFEWTIQYNHVFIKGWKPLQHFRQITVENHGALLTRVRWLFCVWIGVFCHWTYLLVIPCVLPGESADRFRFGERCADQSDGAPFIHCTCSTLILWTGCTHYYVCSTRHFECVCASPSSHRTTFYLISQNKVKHQAQWALARHPSRRTNDNKKPSDRITHAGTIKISRSE